MDVCTPVTDFLSDWLDRQARDHASCPEVGPQNPETRSSDSELQCRVMMNLRGGKWYCRCRKGLTEGARDGAGRIFQSGRRGGELEQSYGLRV